MRTVAARQFQRKFYKEIKELPVVVTNYGEKQFILAPYSETLEKFINGEILPEGEPQFTKPVASYIEPTEKELQEKKKSLLGRIFNK